MTERTRNIAVGLTVLIALVLLAILIVIFTGLPQWFRSGTTVVVDMKQSYEITPGDPVYLLGRRVGVVRSVTFTDGDPLRGVTLIAKIDGGIRLPRNVRAHVASRGLMGRKYISLVPDGPVPADPERRYHPQGDSVHLTAGPPDSPSLLPKEISDAMEDFGKLASRLNELIGPTTQPTSAPTSGPASPPPGLQGTVTRMNRTLDALYEIVGDEDNRANLASALKNFSQASAGAEELMRKLMTDAEDISAVMNQLHAAVEKVNRGEGSIGKLVNDPQLYTQLVRAADQMERLLGDMRRLVEKWDKEGLGVKLK